MARYYDPLLTESEAVVREAEALERETRRETGAFVLAESGCRVEPTHAEEQIRYLRMRDAAAVVVEIGYWMQDPLRDNPYAPLAAKIMAKAKAVLSEIEAGDLYGRPRDDDPASAKV